MLPLRQAFSPGEFVRYAYLALACRAVGSNRSGDLEGDVRARPAAEAQAIPGQRNSLPSALQYEHGNDLTPDCRLAGPAITEARQWQIPPLATALI
jgi:hypothetical protein